MGVAWLLSVPLVALALDYTSWLEACWFYAFLRDPRGSQRTLYPPYWHTQQLFIRNALLDGMLLFCWIASRAEGADAIAAASASSLLLIVYAGVALWSFRNNLDDFYAEREANSRSPEVRK